MVKGMSLLRAYVESPGRVLQMAFAGSVPLQMLEKPGTQTIIVVAFPKIDLSHSSRHMFTIVLPLYPSRSLDGAQRNPGFDG
jgi:hypothetical protein